MRNKFGGYCYRCDKWVKPQDGHFERYRGGWRVQHAKCCIEHKEKKRDANREMFGDAATEHENLGLDDIGNK